VKPAKIFVVNMGDLFAKCIPDEWLVRILEIPFYAPQHTFQFLTKNPVLYERQSPWLSHEWLGITVTCQQDWNERWPILAELEARVKFVSFEPLLGPVEMGESQLPDWIIIGSQTKPTLIPDSYWVNELLWEARQARIPAFVKDNLSEARAGYYIPRPQEFPK